MARFKGIGMYLVHDLHVDAAWVTCPGCGRLHLCLAGRLTCAACLQTSQLATLRLVAALSHRRTRVGMIVHQDKAGSA